MAYNSVHTEVRVPRLQPFLAKTYCHGPWSDFLQPGKVPSIGNMQQFDRHIYGRCKHLFECVTLRFNTIFTTNVSPWPNVFLLEIWPYKYICKIVHEHLLLIVIAHTDLLITVSVTVLVVVFWVHWHSEKARCVIVCFGYVVAFTSHDVSNTIVS